MASPEPPDDGPLAVSGAARLLAHLRTALAQPELTYARTPTRITGGNETYIYDFSLAAGSPDLARPLILRAYRQGYARPDQARFEAAVQNAVADQGYPAARVLVVAPDDAVLGTPFIVMERLPGVAMLEGVGEFDQEGHIHFDRGRSLLSGIGLRRKIPRACAQAQLRLHALDPQLLLNALAREGLPQTYVTLEGRLQLLRDWVGKAKLAGARPILDWLIEKTPPPARAVICHSDMQPNNLLMSGDEITGVVDWSQVIVADPALDIGYTKMAFESVPLQMPRFLHWIGRPIVSGVTRDYVKAYMKDSAINLESVQYYGVQRALLALAGICVRRAAGTSEPDVWDNPIGVRNLIAWIHRATGIEVTLPAS